MPFYEYECPSCRYYLEVLQKVSDKPLKKCPSCGKAGFKKLVSAPVFRLKGSGWYETDFKSEGDSKRNLAGPDRDEAPASSDAKPAADGKSGTEAKPGAEDKAGSDAKGGAEGKAGAEAKPSAEGKAGREAKGTRETKTSGRTRAKASSGRGRTPTAKRPAARSAKKAPARGGKRR